MTHAEICPICGGDGKKPNPKNMDDSFAKCHGCSGKGWVEVGDNILDPALIPFAPSEPRKIPEPYPWHPYYPTITWQNPETHYFVTCIS